MPTTLELRNVGRVNHPDFSHVVNLTISGLVDLPCDTLAFPNVQKLDIGHIIQVRACGSGCGILCQEQGAA